MKRLFFRHLPISTPLCIALFCVSGAVYATPSELTDLVGARASAGESALKARGYQFIRAQQGDDRVWTYWYKPSSKSCVTVATYDGRYNAITESPHDCGEPYLGNNDHVNNDHSAEIAGTAVAIGAIALAIHEHNKDKKEHHSTVSGTPDAVKDLVGSRAAGAENVLMQNGYQDIKGYTGASTKEVLWWNPMRHDCIAVVTYDGRINGVNTLDAKRCESAPINHQPAANPPLNNHAGNAESYSPAPEITCYRNQQTCYRFGQGVDQYWTSKEF